MCPNRWKGHALSQESGQCLKKESAKVSTVKTFLIKPSPALSFLVQGCHSLFGERERYDEAAIS